MEKHELNFPTRCDTPLSSNYHPSEDTTPELDASSVQYFQDIIGVLRWVVELDRVEILLEVALLSTHLTLPREGHLQQVYHSFGYLKKSLRRIIFMDPDHPNIYESRFNKFDWVVFYIDAEK